MIKVNELKSAHAPIQSVHTPAEQGSIKWEGHMADDVGSTFGPEPMAFLSATAEELVLSGTRGTYKVPRVAVTKVGRGKLYPWFFSALRISHTVERLPRDLQFKPLGQHWRQVMQKLRELGYPSA
jgi:hypothetical protein